MKYRIDKIATKVTWDELTCTGNVEVTTLIDGIEKQALENQTGLYLTRPEAYTEPVLCACVIDAEGKEKDRIFPLPLENEISFCMRVEQPKLWNAEDPYCYQLILEILEGENFSHDRRTESLAFWDWKIVGGQTCINGKEVNFRAAALPEGKKASEVQQFLRIMKQTYKNTLLIKADEKNHQLEKWCREYGIYLLEDGQDADAGWLRARLDLNRENEKNPDFQLQVVQTGVLIENHSTFINASEYNLHYEILDSSGKKCSENELCTDVPAGTSKFVDIPFRCPAEPGEYRYQVSLCLKKDVIWAPKGYVIATTETKISNLYERLENENQ